LCIDACDQVMNKLGVPGGLVRFMTEKELAGEVQPKAVVGRPRIVVYASLLLLFSFMGAWALAERSLLLVDVLRDRGALYRETGEGNIENAYTLKLMNLDDTPRRFSIGVDGLSGIAIVGNREFTVDAGTIRPLPITVTMPGNSSARGIQPIQFRIAADDDPSIAIEEKSSFVLP
jgi:polyferredoxin